MITSQQPRIEALPAKQNPVDNGIGRLRLLDLGQNPTGLFREFIQDGRGSGIVVLAGQRFDL